MIDAGTLLFLLSQTCDVEPEGSWVGPDHVSYTTTIRRRGWLPKAFRPCWAFTISHRNCDEIPQDADWTVIRLDNQPEYGLVMNDEDLAVLARLVHGVP